MSVKREKGVNGSGPKNPKKSGSLYEMIDLLTFFKNNPVEFVKSTLEKAMEENDMVVINNLSPLFLPPGDKPFNQKLARYLSKLVPENINELNAENQLLVLEMDDRFFPDKNHAIFLLVALHLSKLKNLDNIKTVLNMDFVDKQRAIQHSVMFKIGNFINDAETQQYLLTLPNDYFESKPDAFEHLLVSKYKDLTDNNLQFLLGADVNNFNNKDEAIVEYKRKRNTRR
jgi:hypothetical protein